MNNWIIIQNLNIEVSWKHILKNINLTFEIGKNYLLLWQNWSWKSSLAQFLMWSPKYEHISWDIFLNNESIIELDSYERAKRWIFLAFQNVPEIVWVNLWDYLRIIYNNNLKTNPDFQKSGLKELTPFVFKRFLKKYLDELEINIDFLERDLNVWFSWWEKRKIELLQARLLEPKFIILDEIDSWLDIVSFEKISKYLNVLNKKENSLIIITHNFNIINYLDIDRVYVLKDGIVYKTGNKDLIHEIKEKWFN